MNMGAILSPCNVYRYRLERLVQSSGETFGFFGINPSTADATQDDHTVRKWRGFTYKWGGRRFLVGNVFAYRATDVNDLATASDPVGPDNDKHLQWIAADADILVPCWGKVSKVPYRLRARFDQVVDMLLTSGKPVMHLGKMECGSPRHPLTLSYDTQLQNW
jgi:hypothetical protein